MQFPRLPCGYAIAGVSWYGSRMEGRQMGSITIDWSDDTHQCIHAIYGQGWDWPEFFATDETAKAMLDTLDHKADFILELADEVLPKNVVGQFPQLVRRAASLTHRNSRRVVIVGSGSHVQILLG